MKQENRRSDCRFLAVLLGLALSSCGTSPPLGTATNTYLGDSSGKQEEFLGDRDLANKFVLLNVKTENVEGRLRRVQFDLKNTTSADLPIEWSIEWRDANGFRLDTNAFWRPFIVPGKGFVSIQETAPMPEAVMFQPRIRKPTPVR